MSEASQTVLVFIVFAIIFALGCMFGCVGGHVNENDEWREWAVDTGHAEYFLNEKHQKKWRWVEQ